MAVPEQTPFIEFTANGITTVFPLPFQCDKSEYLIVSLDGEEAPVGSWNLAGGSITFNAAPTNGVLITIERNTPFRRTTNYQSYDNSFRPEPVNKDFDLIWWKLQELGVADWILGNRINALKNYVDDRDDELRAYLLEEIRKQGVALDQLEDYYNYLMERLAQIAVDRGWDSSFVVHNGENLKSILDEQAALNEITARNVTLIADLYGLVGKNQQRVFVQEIEKFYTYYPDTNQVENGVTVVDKWVMDTQPFYQASWFAQSNGTDQKGRLAIGYAYATSKKRPFVIDSIFHLSSESANRACFNIISNSELLFLPQGKFVQLPNSFGEYQLIRIYGAENYKIINANLEGDKLTHLGTTGEWGHLLAIFDSKNGYIFRPKLNFAWGDGLYIGRLDQSVLDYDPTNITVVEPEISGCRRNGLSFCSGNNVQVIRPKIKRIGDYDGVNGTFPKACIDVEPNKFVAGFTQSIIKDCVIEDALLSESYTGLYVSSHWDNVDFNIHIKGITRITSTTNNCFGFWNGGAGSKGSVVIDHIICDGSQSFVGSQFAWGADGTLTLEVKQLDIAPNWTIFSFYNLFNGAFLAKTLGNFVIRNIKWGVNTTCRFVYEVKDQPYTFNYQFFKHPSVLKEFDIYHSGVTTVAQAPTFGSLFHMDGSWNIVTEYSFSKLKPSTIVQSQADATARYISMAGDYSIRTIMMNPLVSDPNFGVYISNVNLLINGVAYTRLSSKVRGASVTLQNVQGGNTRIINMIGDWQFSA